jgi:DNA-binding NarL/FixJ family response regulator
MAMFTAVARDGPGEAADLDLAQLQKYGKSAPEADWAAEVLLIAGRPHDAVAIAATVRDEETHLRYWGLIPASIVHAIGLFASHACDDQPARERFISSLLTERPLPVSPPFNKRHVALANADIAEHGGRIDEALAAYAVVLAEAELSQYNNNVVYLTSLIRQRRAELFLRLSPPDVVAAQSEFDALLTYWRKAKATWYLGQLRNWAEARGLAFPRTDEVSTAAPAAPRQLTHRELEVARLVAQGLTNREIGARLTLSVRTAESHVEQIRAKLGFKTRAQIASWVTERYGATRP